VIEHLPLLNSSVASRWVTYFWLFAALLLTLIVDAVYTAVAKGRHGQRAAVVWSGVLAVVVLVPLLPAWPYSAAPPRSRPGSPAPPNPSPRVRPPSSTRWPARRRLVHAVAGLANMQFRQPGGFAVIPGSDGANTFNGDPSPLQGALAQCEGGASSVDFPAADVRAQLRQWRTGTVAVIPSAPGAACATALFTAALGPARRMGGVLVWPNLDRGS
jgi:hypothetical protein